MKAGIQGIIVILAKAGIQDNIVILAKAGISDIEILDLLDSRLRGNDGRASISPLLGYSSRRSRTIVILANAGIQDNIVILANAGIQDNIVILAKAGIQDIENMEFSEFPLMWE